MLFVTFAYTLRVVVSPACRNHCSQGNLVIVNGFGGKADNYVKAELRAPLLNLDVCSKISPCIHVL